MNETPHEIEQLDHDWAREPRRGRIGNPYRSVGDVIDVYDMCRLEGLKTPHFATTSDAF